MLIIWLMMVNHNLVGGWVDLPLWKIMEFVSWDDDSIPNWMGSHKIHVPNHQSSSSSAFDSPLITILSIWQQAQPFQNHHPSDNLRVVRLLTWDAGDVTGGAQWRWGKKICWFCRWKSHRLLLDRPMFKVKSLLIEMWSLNFLIEQVEIPTLVNMS